MIAYYDRNGDRLPDNWLQQQHYRESNITDHRVARTTVNGIDVSTCWVGLDMASMGAPPMFFETMTFGDPWGYECVRYGSEEAALRGHLDAVDRLRAGRPPFPYLDGDE